MTNELSGQHARSIAAILFAVSVIVLSAVIPASAWPVHGLLLTMVFVLQTLARVPMSLLVRRLAIFLPIVGVFAVSIPLMHGFQSGVELGASIFLRSTVSFFVLFWLVRAFSFLELTTTLAACGVPKIFVSMLQLMHRYFGILWEEQQRMLLARRARTFRRQRWWSDWIATAQILGMLLIRALARAERVHLAMQARGWNGENPPLSHSDEWNR